MFSEITVLSMLAIIIAKDKTICQSKKQGGASPPGSYGPVTFLR